MGISQVSKKIILCCRDVTIFSSSILQAGPKTRKCTGRKWRGEIKRRAPARRQRIPGGSSPIGPDTTTWCGIRSSRKKKCLEKKNSMFHSKDDDSKTRVRDHYLSLSLPGRASLLYRIVSTVVKNHQVSKK